LKDCELRHQCGSRLSTRPNTQPSLLVDVISEKTTPDLVKLHTVGSQNLKYAALSYCWGGAQTKATTTTTIKTYLDQISITSLPSSLRDAIWVTRKLGLQYLWVDSLCIVQDDEIAKVHEIGRMEHIYNNAYVTISADCASSCHTSFLHTNIPDSASSALPFVWDDNESGTILFTSINNPQTSLRDSHRNSPIHTRGWTLQERFMSRRLLVYSKYKIFWVCARGSDKDGGDENYEDYDYSDAQRRPQLSTTTPHAKNDTTRHGEEWRSLVVEYSKRKLSDSSDKLPAFSSIAAYFATRLNDDYVAGLWRRQLPNMLCWRGVDVSRPENWRAPSWSYMAIDGQIIFPKPAEKRGEFFEIKDVQITPVSSEAPYGKISSGRLLARCRVLQISATGSGWICSNDCYSSVHEGGRVKLEPVFDSCRGHHATVDCITTCYATLDPVENLWCVSLSDDRDSEGVRGLLLAKLDNYIYHRVGYFTCKSSTAKELKMKLKAYKTLFLSCPLEDIIII
jgi:hypothetical protein